MGPFGKCFDLSVQSCHNSTTFKVAGFCAPSPYRPPGERAGPQLPTTNVDCNMDVARRQRLKQTTTTTATMLTDVAQSYLPVEVLLWVVEVKERVAARSWAQRSRCLTVTPVLLTAQTRKQDNRCRVMQVLKTLKRLIFLPWRLAATEEKKHKMAAAAAPVQAHLAVQDVEALDPAKLTPLTPEVISRQVICQERRWRICVELSQRRGGKGVGGWGWE